MTSDREFERLVRSWLDESSTTPEPDRLLESVLFTTARRRSRPSWLVRLVGEPMATHGAARQRMVAFGLATAAIILAGAIGLGLVLRPDRNVGPSPVPVQSAVPTATPGATPSPRPASWITTGKMTTARAQFTATLLANGRVLAAGGNSADYTGLASAELYDPNTGLWPATGSMSQARWRHTATLLLDGSVLVTGGQLGIAYLASAELYDPRTGTWRTTGSMTTARADHTATLLADGRVLVLGGSLSETLSAEVFDPQTGTWSASGTSFLLGKQTAMRLADGRVLVIGQGPAEVYDPRTGEWSTGSTPDVIRWHSTAVPLADGRVLMAGGEIQRQPNIFSPELSAELYNPGTGTWSPTGSLNTGASGAPGILLADGAVLVVKAMGGTERYDPRTGTWSVTGGPTFGGEQTTVGGGDFAVTLLANGMVLVAGGVNNATGERLAAAELYDPGIGP
jgi:hypothetical protein